MEATTTDPRIANFWRLMYGEVVFDANGIFYNPLYVTRPPAIAPTDDTRLDCWAEQDTVIEG